MIYIFFEELLLNGGDLKSRQNIYIHAHTYAYAGVTMVKVISLSNKAYSTLKALKRGDDSFSDVVLKIAEKEKKPSIMDLAGKWPLSDEETEKIKKEIARSRKHFKLREVQF